MKPSENMIISPLSAANSLALLTQATNGRTHDEIRNALHLGINTTVIANQFQELYSEITEDNYTLTTANQIYVQPKCEVNRNFQQVANTKFMSGVENLHFGHWNDSARINQIIEKTTNKTVHNSILPNRLNEETQLILVNAIHLARKKAVSIRKRMYAPWCIFYQRKRNGRSRVHINCVSKRVIYTVQNTTTITYTIWMRRPSRCILVIHNSHLSLSYPTIARVWWIWKPNWKIITLNRLWRALLMKNPI